MKITIGNGNGTFNSSNCYSINQSFVLELGDFTGDGALDISTAQYANGTINILTGNTKDGVNPLLPFDLTTMSGARQALPVFDKKIQQLATQRGKIGAFQSRVQVGISNLQSSSENYSAAEARLRNADIADESSKLVRQNILQQSASSILAQANLQPSLAVQLLRG